MSARLKAIPASLCVKVILEEVVLVAQVPVGMMYRREHASRRHHLHNTLECLLWKQMQGREMFDRHDRWAARIHHRLGQLLW